MSTATTARSAVCQIAPADSASALAHFSRALQLETDCWDVHDSISRGLQDFVLLDVRSEALYRQGHLPNAVHFPHGKLIASRLQQYPHETVFVVYCAGPHCNGAHKAALRLATLQRPVKLMIGGITGWQDEGFTLVSGPTGDKPSPAE